MASPALPETSSTLDATAAAIADLSQKMERLTQMMKERLAAMGRPTGSATSSIRPSVPLTPIAPPPPSSPAAIAAPPVLPSSSSTTSPKYSTPATATIPPPTRTFFRLPTPPFLAVTKKIAKHRSAAGRAMGDAWALSASHSVSSSSTLAASSTPTASSSVAKKFTHRQQLLRRRRIRTPVREPHRPSVSGQGRAPVRARRHRVCRTRLRGWRPRLRALRRPRPRVHRGAMLALVGARRGRGRVVRLTCRRRHHHRHLRLLRVQHHHHAFRGGLPQGTPGRHPRCRCWELRVHAAGVKTPTDQAMDNTLNSAAPSSESSTTPEYFPTIPTGVQKVFDEWSNHQAASREMQLGIPQIMLHCLCNQDAMRVSESKSAKVSLSAQQMFDGMLSRYTNFLPNNLVVNGQYSPHMQLEMLETGGQLEPIPWPSFYTEHLQKSQFKVLGYQPDWTWSLIWRDHDCHFILSSKLYCKSTAAKCFIFVPSLKKVQCSVCVQSTGLSTMRCGFTANGFDMLPLLRPPDQGNIIIGCGIAPSMTNLMNCKCINGSRGLSIVGRLIHTKLLFPSSCNFSVNDGKCYDSLMLYPPPLNQQVCSGAVYVFEFGESRKSKLTMIGIPYGTVLEAVHKFLVCSVHSVMLMLQDVQKVSQETIFVSGNGVLTEYESSCLVSDTEGKYDQKLQETTDVTIHTIQTLQLQLIVFALSEYSNLNHIADSCEQQLQILWVAQNSCSILQLVRVVWFNTRRKLQFCLEGCPNVHQFNSCHWFEGQLIELPYHKWKLNATIRITLQWQKYKDMHNWLILSTQALELPWDPGGIKSGLRASRILSGGECHGLGCWAAIWACAEQLCGPGMGFGYMRRKERWKEGGEQKPELVFNLRPETPLSTVLAPVL